MNEGWVVGVFVLLAGCSGCAASSTQSTTGTAEVDGTVDGEPMTAASAMFGISPSYVFVFTHVISTHQEVAITDVSQSCADGRVTGSTALYIDLFHDPSQPDSTVTSAGAFDVWLPPINTGTPLPTGDMAVVTFDRPLTDGGGAGYLAQAGTVTVTDVSAGQIRGTFAVTFANGALSGSFTAPACDPWLFGASIP